MSTPLTAAQLRAAYMSGETTVPELLRERLQRLRRAHAASPDPAWISLASGAQLEAQLDALAPRAIADCPLYGVPFAIKDNIDAAGWRTTAACPEFAYTATTSAHVVTLLQRAGAVLLGKTNLDQFATGLVGTRSPFGAVPNTFSARHVSGGSSSGSASVVARGLVSFALGTDTAGSGRVPAGFNNLVGCKPTPGTISTAGVVPACRTLDCVSLLTLTTADAAAVYAVLAGADRLAPGEPVFARASTLCHGFAPRPVVGVPRDPSFVDEHYRAAFDTACEQLGALGCTVEAFDLAPFAEVAALLYDGPWTAERYAIAGALIERGATGLDPAVVQVVSTGKGYSALDAFTALYRVREIDAQLRPLWSRLDALMVPTAPNLPTLDDVAAAPVARNSELGTYTNFVNLLGMSALAVPAAFTPAGLPFGVTFLAPGGCDWALLELGARWQRERALPLGTRLRAQQPEDTRIAATPPGALPLAVVGAHLSGMPLHHQLTACGARLRALTRTAPGYRLYALPGGSLARPALVHTGAGAAIEVEVYDVPSAAVGAFLAGIASPLGLGTVELADGSRVTGFICEPGALDGAEDITAYGGWRNYMKAGGTQRA